MVLVASKEIHKQINNRVLLSLSWTGSTADIACPYLGHLHYEFDFLRLSESVNQRVWQYPEHLYPKHFKKSHVWNTCTTLFVFLGQLDELDNVPAQTVSIVWLFPVHLVSKALNLDVSVRNTCATVFGFLGQLDEIDNISDICVPAQTISIHCLFDNCTTVWDNASCLIHRIDFLTIACNVSVDFFYLKTCLTLLWCSTRSLTLCTTERYCLNIYMYTSFN